MGESHIDFHMQYVIMTLAGGGRVIDNDTLKMRKLSNFKIYVLLQPICAGEVSFTMAIDK